MQSKIWSYKPNGLDSASTVSLAEKFHIPKVVAALLLNRGISTEQQIKSYLQKSLEGVHNPNLLPDMEKAVARITSALENKEKIVVYGDYDVDGITSTALLYDFLKNAGAEVDYYIPDRINEGYGLNIMAVNKISKSGAKLMITVDCGITSVGEVALANAQKLDVIVTDHHTCKDKLPEAVAVINPKRPDAEYPFRELAGVGVAFKLILALTVAWGQKSRQCFEKYAEIAAVGTIADVVELLDENRIIVDRGLAFLQNTKRPGLKALTEVAGIKNVNATSVAFFLSPRLNAAGRLGSAQTAVRLLLCDNDHEAYEIAKALDDENRRRQLTEQKIFQEAVELIDSDPNFEQKKVIVLAKEGWHHGVIGIVASRICEKYYRPCILISHENGVGKGSGRSIAGFNLFDALTVCKDQLTNFGGHAMAAGLGLNIADLEAFTAKINNYAKDRLTPEDMQRHINIDCMLCPEDVSIRSIALLSRLEPFGMGNEKPVFSLCGLTVQNIGVMGIDNKHLRLRLTANGRQFSAVGFGMGGLIQNFRQGDRLDAAFTMEINSYQGNEQAQLLLKDIRHSV